MSELYKEAELDRILDSVMNKVAAEDPENRVSLSDVFLKSPLSKLLLGGGIGAGAGALTGYLRKKYLEKTTGKKHRYNSNHILPFLLGGAALGGLASGIPAAWDKSNPINRKIKNPDPSSMDHIRQRLKNDALAGGEAAAIAYGSGTLRNKYRNPLKHLNNVKSIRDDSNDTYNNLKRELELMRKNGPSPREKDFFNRLTGKNIAAFDNPQDARFAKLYKMRGSKHVANLKSPHINKHVIETLAANARAANPKLFSNAINRGLLKRLGAAAFLGGAAREGYQIYKGGDPPNDYARLRQGISDASDATARGTSAYNDQAVKDIDTLKRINWAKYNPLPIAKNIGKVIYDDLFVDPGPMFRSND